MSDTYYEPIELLIGDHTWELGENSAPIDEKRFLVDIWMANLDAPWGVHQASPQTLAGEPLVLKEVPLELHRFIVSPSRIVQVRWDINVPGWIREKLDKLCDKIRLWPEIDLKIMREFVQEIRRSRVDFGGIPVRVRLSEL